MPRCGRPVHGSGTSHKRELRMNFQGGGKPRPYYTRAWRADPCSGRGDPCGRPGWRWGLAKVRAYGGTSCGCQAGCNNLRLIHLFTYLYLVVFYHFLCYYTFARLQQSTYENTQ